MTFYPIAISTSLAVFLLSACSSATTSQTTEVPSALSLEVPPKITTTKREVTWTPENMLNIIPPKAVMDSITKECKAQGFDLGYITSISLEGDNVTAIFNCRGAG